MKKSTLLFTLAVLSLIVIAAVVPTTIDDFFMPGSQPGESGNIESPDKCDNCHGGYDQAIEPAFNWRGSMMAQAARDPLFYACLAIAEQDAPGSGDLCIRCHAPDGWLAGRSTPTDGSALNNNDREGVQCDFCHKLVKPSELNVNPFPGDPDYTNDTYPSDQEYLGTITMIPPQSGNGMYIAHSSNAKRGPFTDAAAKHQIHYSPFHSESAICGTCHDVSSPAIDKDGALTLGGITKGENAFITSNMLPIERTYSEWSVSEFATTGVSGTPFGGNKAVVSTCQDCHMKDVSGVAANKRGTVFRDNLPLHDFTGGNTFIPDLVAQLYPAEINTDALDAGKQRALGMLQNAATLELDPKLAQDGSGTVTVTITNNTGHKLPSGYPEGRRIWVNVQAYDINKELLYESGAYDLTSAILEKHAIIYTNGTPQVLQDELSKIYEIKLGMAQNVLDASGLSNEADGTSFHFVLNNHVVKDNRIPPRGFTNANFESIQSPVIGYAYDDLQYSDDTQYTLPTGTFHVVARLMYQTASKEYVEFLRDKNVTNDAGQILYEKWELNGKSAPVVMQEMHYYNGEVPKIPLSVQDVTFTRFTAKGSKTYVTALVSVVDDSENVVPGVVVNANFSGPTSKDVSGTTNSSGLVEFTSPSTRGVTGEWCLTINTMDKTGYEFTIPETWCESGFQTTASAKSAVIDIAETSGFKVYPNPFSDKLYFEFSREQDEHCRIEVFDISGRTLDVVFDRIIQAGESYKVEYNTNSLGTNLLFYRIQFDDEVINGKVVHQ